MKNTVEKEHTVARLLHCSLHTIYPVSAPLISRKHARFLTLQISDFTWYSLCVKKSLKAPNHSAIVERR